MSHARSEYTDFQALAPDAFEVALLDAKTMTPLAGTATGLTGTDALLNLQPNGQVYYAPAATVPATRWQSRSATRSCHPSPH